MKNSNALEMLRIQLKDNILLLEQTAAIKGGCWGWLKKGLKKLSEVIVGVEYSNGNYKPTVRW